MIDLHGMISIPYLKKAAFTGSFQGMRYRIKKENRDEKDVLEAVVWSEPYNYDNTPEEKKRFETFEFSQDGMEASVRWLEDQYQKKEEQR